MIITRVIPCLLLRRAALVKTVRFKKPSYVGDPINTVRIFNEQEVDELVFLDITATVEARPPPLDLIAEISRECFMPFGYGGGIRTLDDVRQVLATGAEKAIINTAAWKHPELIQKAADHFGSQSIIVSMDVKRTLFGKPQVVVASGQESTGMDPVTYAKRAADLGAGEILLTSVDREGTFTGYDLDLVRQVTQAVGIPVVANGGAGNLGHLREVVREGGASAAAAGSLFVFQGAQRAVLINYPDRKALDRLFADEP
jgi:cyclase